MKYLFTGDWHLRGTNPRNRVDDYKSAVITKLREIFMIAEKEDVRAIIIPGDIFDRPEVSIGVLLEFVEVIRECKIKIITTAGNHDIYGYNLDSYNRSSLKLLEMLVPNFKVFLDPTEVFLDGDNEVSITFCPYDVRMDHDGYGYSPGKNLEAKVHIHVAHGMLLDHEPPFDKFTLIKDVNTTADLVLTGHDHTGFGIYKRADGVIFCNPGSISRMSASITEIERPIQIALIDIVDAKIDIKLLPLESARPGNEILDRSKIESEKQRQYAMEEFAALIQDSTGGKVLLNINDIVEAIATQESFDADVIKKTLEKIEEEQMNI